MKKLISISIIFLIGLSCAAQLPDLVGEKATIKQLKSSYRSYSIESGRVLDVRTYDDDDNIYLDAIITGSSLDYEFRLTSNSNGVVTIITYIYDNIQESSFNYLKDTIIKMHKAQFNSKSSGTTVYTSTHSGLKRYILFTRDINSNATITFKL